MLLKKIDLHIHTKSTSSDQAFSFSIDNLEKYVNFANLDIFAITNHNIFDIENFNLILERFKDKNKLILPGIEVDVKNGHLLLITDFSNIDDFIEKCNKINEITRQKEYLDIDEFNNLNIDSNSYLLIPHYQKSSKNISDSDLKEFNYDIKLAEVSNTKRFFKLKNNKSNSLVPLLFSDLRIGEDWEKIKDQSSKNTLINFLKNELSFENFKKSINHKERVFLDGLDGYFSLQKSKTKVYSNGINLLFGKRGTGKNFYFGWN